MSEPKAPRRRFAPVPIETTFKEVRRGGPAAELTPDPSPTSDVPSAVTSPPQAIGSSNNDNEDNTNNGRKRDKRKSRFAPQLIESTRRSRKTNDTGPATKPTDKTDITPYTRHIYSVASRKKERQQKWPGFARRESCDDTTSDRTFQLNGMDAQRRLEAAAMSAFPNSSIRLGGAVHYYVREGSDDDDSQREQQTGEDRRASRRQSSEPEVEVNWMVKEAQSHAAAKHRDEDDSRSISPVSSRSEAPPDNTFAFTSASDPTVRGSFGLSSIGEDASMTGPTPVRRSSRSSSPSYLSPFHHSPSANRLEHRAAMNSYKSHHGTDLTNSPTLRAREHSPGPHSRGAFGRFYGYQALDKAAEKEAFRLKTRASPAMAGKELTFRMSPSPQQTKLEPDQRWDHAISSHAAPNRDVTEKNGLWKGYCYTTNKTEYVTPSVRPAMIMTPLVPSTPMEELFDPFARATGTLSPLLSMEPTSSRSGQFLAPDSRPRGTQPKGLHMLAGLDERLQKEKAAADLQERITDEFTDTFVTQVYNYLSLGYPSMARAYDEELSKIGKISLDELEKDDENVENGISAQRTGKVKGHITKLSMELDMPEDMRCPRWMALKKYILEWASQHPDLNSISPLAWGVSERRGSWGL